MDSATTQVNLAVYDELLKTGKFSDLTIKYREESFKVHKAIICAHSPFFMKACDGNFLVTALLVVSYERHFVMVGRKPIIPINLQ
jgi:speckle-type POZ protein